MHPNESRQLLKQIGSRTRHAALSLRQHRLRSALSTLGISCGVVSFLVMISAGEGAKREMLSQIEQLGMKNILVRATPLTREQEALARNAGSWGLLNSDASHLERAVEAIETIATIREIRATAYSSTKPLSPQILAVTPNLFDTQKLSLASGRFISRMDVDQGHLVCVLGNEVVRKMGRDGRIGGTLRLENTLYHVVGVLDRADQRSIKNSAISARDYNNSVVIPMNVQGTSGTSGLEPITEMIIKIRRGQDVISAFPLIRRILELQHHGMSDYQTVVPQQLLKQADQANATFSTLLGIIALISLLIGGIGIMNVMLANVAERTHEIGLRRALGANRNDIAIQFLAEALLLTCAGGAFGVLVGISGIGILGGFLKLPYSVTPGAVLLPLLMSILTGMLFGIFPAIRAARLDPAVALRS